MKSQLVSDCKIISICIRVGHAVSCGHLHMRFCAYIFNMRIIRILIYAVCADMHIMRMSFPNHICAAQLVTHRCMGKTCGFAAVPAATAAQQPDLVGDFQSRKSTAKQGEK